MDWLTAFDGALLRFGLYLFVFWPTVGYYVYRDAKRRELSSPGARGLGYGFLGVLGLLVYLTQKSRATAES